MSKSNNSKITKASRNYFFNLFSFLPFIFLLFTGIIVLRYHTGTEKIVVTIGLDGITWLKIHQVMALAVLPLIFVHLLMHKHWLKQLLTFKMTGKNSGMTLTLFIVFLLCSITALLAWFVFDETKIAEALREVHNKLGLLLIIFFAIHLNNYFKWFLNMTRKHLLVKAKKKEPTF